MTTPHEPREPFDAHDSWDDALREMGPRLPWPSEPSAVQRARWKQPPRQAARWYRAPVWWWTGSGALAAAVALAAIGVLGARPVSARLILEDLRAALQRNVLLTCDNVQVDFSRVPNAHTDARVVFAGQIYAADAASKRAYLDLDLQVNPSAAAAANAVRFELQVAAVPGAEWGYVRLDSLPLDDLPNDLAWFLIKELVQHGVYLNLAGLLDDADTDVAWPAFGLNDVLSLRDRRMDSLLALVEQVAERVEVRTRSDGMIVLEAAQFSAELDRSALGLPPQLQAFTHSLIDRLVVQVGYQRFGGVQWIRMEHFGHADGTILLEFDEGTFDSAKLERGYHAARHAAPTIDLAALRSIGGRLATLIGL